MSEERELTVASVRLLLSIGSDWCSPKGVPCSRVDPSEHAVGAGSVMGVEVHPLSGRQCL